MTAPFSLRIVDKSNWGGKAPMFPRALPPQVCWAHHSIASIYIVIPALCAINDCYQT